MYKVLLERRVERDLDMLDGSLFKRIIERISLLSFNPRSGAKKLIATKNAWRVRVGDWRIIYEISDNKREVKIYRVKHRSKAY